MSKLRCENEDAIRHEIEKFVSGIVSLSKANRLTGLWDHVRFEECKKRFQDTDPKLIYRSEKNSRANVEARAVHRKALDECLQNLIRSLSK